jgi:phosphoglycolate phosphatase-like HAD superfamily hydrolase
VNDSLPLAIVDIDGVVADVRHRLRHIERGRKNWPAFFAAAGDDPTHPEGLAAVQTLLADHEVVFVSGRPEHLRTLTETWLTAAGLGGHRLHMRREQDRRPAAQIKRDTIARLARDRTIGIVVDDDPKVLEVMRAAGYPTFAATWERRSTDERQALDAAQDRQGLT